MPSQHLPDVSTGTTSRRDDPGCVHRFASVCDTCMQVPAIEANRGRILHNVAQLRVSEAPCGSKARPSASKYLQGNTGSCLCHMVSRSPGHNGDLTAPFNAGFEAVVFPDSHNSYMSTYLGKVASLAPSHSCSIQSYLLWFATGSCRGPASLSRYTPGMNLRHGTRQTKQQISP